MGDSKKQLISIIGAGRVVQAAFRTESPPDNFQIYDQSESTSPFSIMDIKKFESTNSITILCASAEETELVQKFGREKSRLAVAEANLSIVQDLLELGVFDTGTVLVVTNPSEIIAEYIYHRSSNKNIYALGLSNDKKRYQEILSANLAGSIGIKVGSMAGNHYDFPYPILHKQELERSTDEFIKDLKEKLNVKIEKEFEGNTPPAESGALVLLEAIKSTFTNSPLCVSGYCNDFMCFSGGILQGSRFTPVLGYSRASMLAIRSIAKKHLETYFNVIQKGEEKFQCES